MKRGELVNTVGHLFLGACVFASALILAGIAIAMVGMLLLIISDLNAWWIVWVSGFVAVTMTVAEHVYELK